MVGKTIGKYRLVEELARDGASTIYKAVDETLDREVAVKMLDPKLAGSEGLKHFQAEATTLARLHHSDIAGIHEVYKHESDMLLVMELVRGETLEQKIARGGPLPPDEAAQLVAQVLGALGHAHDAGVLHGDLKPSNVTITDTNRLKLTDFGVSRVAGDDDLTSDGFRLQAPSFMAPERLAGKASDTRSDVYSAGVLLYFLLTGHVPFEAASPLDMMRRQLEDRPTPVSQFRPGLPGWCQAVLDRAMARIPADRFQTAEQFKTSLLSSTADATEATGSFRLPVSAGDAPTTAMPMDMLATIAVPTPAPSGTGVAPASNPGLAPTAVELSPVPPTATGPVAVPAPPAAAAPGGTTVIMKKRDMAAAGGVLAFLAVGVVILAVVALRRHEPAPVATTVVAEVPETTTGSPSTESAPAAAEPAAPTPAPVAVAPPPPTPPPAETPVTEPAATAASASAPRPVAGDPKSAAGNVIDPSPYTFVAKAVVVDGSRYRERDAVVQFAEGSVTVKEKDDRQRAIYQFPIASVTELVYSNSRQPLTSTPTGPVEVMRVEGGAFGFLKGGGTRNWLSIRTNDSMLVLRLEDDDAVKVMAALESRTGITPERLVEGKD